MVWSWKHVQQGDRNQLDMGAYYDLSVMTLGVWYRGTPSVCGRWLVGCGRVELRVWVWRDQMGYSYDVALNRLWALGQLYLTKSV